MDLGGIKMYENIDKFKYIRGFLISDFEVNKHFISKEWVKFKNDYYHFYFDSNTKWKYLDSKEGIWGALIGSCIDPINKTNDSEFILNHVINLYNKSNDKLFDYIENLVGRYVFIIGNGNNSIIFTDATGMRSTFYSTNKNIIASHAKLIHEIDNNKLNNDIDLKWLTQYTNYQLPGNTTPFDGVYFLIPNHLLEWPNNIIRRYFPRKPILYTDMDTIVEQITENTKTQLKILAQSNKFIFSLSGGVDSRTSLALIKDYSDITKFFTYYFTNSNDPTYKGSDTLNLDFKIVNDIKDNLQLDHTFIPIDRAETTSETFLNFKEILSNNTFLNHSALLAKEYLDNFGMNNYIHIRSNIYGVGRPVFRNLIKSNVSNPGLDDFIKVYNRNAVNDKKIREIYSEYLNHFSPLNVYNYDPFDLLYWENRLGTWHSQLIIQSDISHDTHIFVNSQNLLKNLLSLPVSMRKNGEILLEIIEHNWPLLKFWDINNDSTLLTKYNSKINTYNSKLDKIKFLGGNIKDKNKVVPINFEKYDTSANFNIDKNAPQLGDFAEAILKYDFNGQSNNEIIIHLRNTYENPKNTGRLKYQIIVNDNLILEEDIAHWRETNQIIIPSNKLLPVTTLKIRVLATKNCEEWNWGKAGTIIIEKISLRKSTSVAELKASSPYSTILEN